MELVAVVPVGQGDVVHRFHLPGVTKVLNACDEASRSWIEQVLWNALVVDRAPSLGLEAFLGRVTRGFTIRDKP